MGKLRIAESVLATTIDRAREAVQAVDDAEDLGLKQRVAALQAEVQEVAAAVEASKAEAVAAADDWSARRGSDR